MVKITQVISGGQTGVDRAALEAAIAVGIPIGGFCPLGRRSEDGPVPDRYPLTELASRGYEERTRAVPARKEPGAKGALLGYPSCNSLTSLRRDSRTALRSYSLKQEYPP